MIRPTGFPSEFSTRLIRAGVARRHAIRAQQELLSHYAELYQRRLDAGMTAEAAATNALEALGAEADIVARYKSQTNLMRWPNRIPVISLIVLPSAIYVACFITVAASIVAP